MEQNRHPRNEFNLQPTDSWQRCQKHTHGRKDGVCNKESWENWTSICRTLKADLPPRFLIYTKTSSKCIKDLHGRPEATKLLEEDIGETFKDSGTDRKSPTSRQQSRRDKWDNIKLGSFCIANNQPSEETTNRTGEQNIKRGSWKRINTLSI